MSKPLVSLRLVDAPSQRLYVLSAACLLQGLKMFSFFRSLLDTETSINFFKWTIYDCLFLLLLWFLAVPRLNFRWQASALQLFILMIFNWFLFGNYTLGSYGPTNWWIRYFTSTEGITGARVSLARLLNQDKHLMGEHTVRLSPISTARVNPYLESFCIPANTGHTFVPVLFNNTEPVHLTYSLSPLTDTNAKVYTTLKRHQLITDDQLVEATVATIPKQLTPDEQFDLEFGEFDPDDPRSPNHKPTAEKIFASLHPRLQKTQRIRWIKITKPGVLRLENVVDGKTEVKTKVTDVIVSNCPSANFVGDADEKIRCTGSNEDLMMHVFGVPPLSLQWQREIEQKREQFYVEGIEVPNRPKQDQPYVAQNVMIPLSLTLDVLGQHVYSLNKLTDGLGNKLELLGTDNAATTRSIAVVKPAAFSFLGCGAGQTVNLIHGKETTLRILSNEHNMKDAPWKLEVKYTPPASSTAAGWTKTFTSAEKLLTLNAEGPGDYRLLGVQGSHCTGEVLSPEVCRVVEIPRPRIEIEWKKLHECSADVGVTASLVLHGTPPFQVSYKTIKKGGSTTTESKLISGSRADVTLTPGQAGSFTFQFDRLSDFYYKNELIDAPTMSLTVHPLAFAKFGKTEKQTVQSCSGDIVDVPLDLTGTPPWHLELQTLGPSGSQTWKVRDIKDPKHVLKVKIPSDVDRDGGVFSLDLVSVEDKNGCKRPLSVAGVSVNVRRVKPTAKFYAKDGNRQVTVLYGADAKLPLRLTGDGPWRLSYRHLENPSKIHKVIVKSANDDLIVFNTGTYEIVEISDNQCPGVVLAPEHTYEVDWVPLPEARLSDLTRVSQATNGSFIRAPVCVGIDDYVDVELKGRPPFQVTYNIGRGEVAMEKHSFSSLQTTSRIALKTSQPGRIYYQVTHVGDTLYPLDDQSEIPERRRLRFEQQVLARPTAYFKSNARLPYCLNDAFIPKTSSYSPDGLIAFEGKPPFVVHFSIKNLASSEIRKEILEFSTKEWRLNFPNYYFTAVGAYLISIDAVHDASSCDEVLDESLQRTLWVDVAETALIVPYERRTDVCVSDLLQFQLEGTPPWTITYRFNEKVSTTTQKTSKYVTVADAPGIFSVVSIAHQQAMCSTTITDVRLTVHEIPSARVHHGTRFEESIKEGEQAEIVFTLVGDPPFTFTYQRTELQQYARGKKPKVLEQHTVSGVTAKEYSIFSSAEGTWTVTFIADKWCRYPPAQIDPSIEKV